MLSALCSLVALLFASGGTLTLGATLCVGMAVLAARSTGWKVPKRSELKDGDHVALPVAYVHWFPSLNNSRANKNRHLPKGREVKDKETQGGVYESLRDMGWQSELPAQVGPMPYAHNKLATVENAIKERQALLKEWESSEDTLAMANVMRDVWFPNGKAIEPLVFGNSGNGRGLSLPYILTDKVQREAAAGRTFEPSAYVVHCLIYEFPSEAERVVRQSFENESRSMKGVLDTSWPDRLAAAQTILQSKGGNESKLRDAFGVGNAQKAYRILQANNQFPSLHLLDRINMPRPDKFQRTPEGYQAGGYIPAQSIEKEALKKAIDTGKATTIETYIKDTVFGGKNEPKTVAKPVWVTIRDTEAQPGSPMALIAKCHIAGVGFDEVREAYPELFSANYNGSIGSGKTIEAKATKAKATKAKA